MESIIRRAETKKLTPGLDAENEPSPRDTVQSTTSNEGAALRNSMILAHYSVLATDHRDLDRQIYQIPSVLVTIASLVMITSYYYLSGLPRAFMLLSGFGLSLSLTIILAKQRYGEDLRAMWMSKMELEHLGRSFPSSTNDVTLDQIEREHGYHPPIPRWFLRQRGFAYIFWLCVFVAGVFLVLSGMQFWLLVGS
jgi:hypothetical protein